MTRSLINTVAITPDVFEDALYENSDRFRECINNLFNGLRATGLVANMGNGEWIKFVTSQSGGKGILAVKLLRTLIERERLIPTPRVSARAASKYEDWLDEALQLLRKRGVQGVISTLHDAGENNTVHPFALNASDEAPIWWNHDPTEKLQKTIPCCIEDYKQVLEPILLNSSKIVFYDRFLDPSSAKNRNFGKILAVCAKNSRRKYLRIELHTLLPMRPTHPDFSGDESLWRLKFSPLCELVATYGLNIQVAVWHWRSLQYYHDRVVLSKIGSFMFGKGFDEGRKDGNIVAFLGRLVTQEWERNFDQNVNQPRFVFRIAAKHVPT